MTRLFTKKWAPYLLLALATVIVWGHTVTYKFVWDDYFFIHDLQSVRSLKNIPEMFTSIEAQASDPYLFRVYRPIRTAQYALLYWIAGKPEPQPWIFHLANVIWHGATAMMLFAMLCRLLPALRRVTGMSEDPPSLSYGAAREGDPTRTWALLIALAFAVHPVVSEVVCWAKSLDDILAAFFTLASLRELLKPGDHRAARWWALFWFALGVYSKESAVPFAVIPFFIYRQVHGFKWREAAQRTFPFLLVGVVYMANRGYIIERNSQTAPLSGSYAQTLLDMFPVVPKYFRLFWGVPPFIIDYKFMKGGFAVISPAVLFGAALLAGLVVAGWLAWRSRSLKAVGFGLLWVGLFLLPVSNVLPMMQYMAERFLYLPLIGWLLAAGALAMFSARAKLLQWLTVLVIVFWAVTAWQRSLIWRDQLTLFASSMLEGHPAERLEHNAVAAILQMPDVARSFAFDEKTGAIRFTPPADRETQQSLEATMASAVKIMPENVALNSFYGMCLATFGRPDQAIPYFEKAVQLSPGGADYWLNLARASLAAGQTARARDAAARAAALAPHHPTILSLQTSIEYQAGDFATARALAREWRAIQPTEENAALLADLEQKLADKKSH